MVLVLDQHRSEIADVCERMRVRRLWLFGSATGRGERPFRPGQSDYDFLVEFGDVRGLGTGWNHPQFQLAVELEKILEHPVEVVEARPFQNPYFARSVERTRVLIYDGVGQEASA